MGAHSQTLFETPQDLLDAFNAALGTEHVRTNEPMSNHTTFKIGGPARLFLNPNSVETIQEAMRIIHENNLSWMVIGQGSDLLFSDEGFDGVIVEVGPEFSKAHVNGNTVIAQAGISMGTLADICAKAGLSGFEFACGIPGTLGGGIFMNAGAYGGQMSDVVESATILLPSGDLEEVVFTGEDFGYRKSPIAQRGVVVLEARLKLTPDNPEEIKARISDLMERRSSKQPLELPSGGSTFKRPEGHYASALIDQAGLKGFQIGGAAVSTKHAGFVVNIDNASAADVHNVIHHVQKTVWDKFGVQLEPEVHIVPSQIKPE